MRRRHGAHRVDREQPQHLRHDAHPHGHRPAISRTLDARCACRANPATTCLGSEPVNAGGHPVASTGPMPGGCWHAMDCRPPPRLASALRPSRSICANTRISGTSGVDAAHTYGIGQTVRCSATQIGEREVGRAVPAVLGPQQGEQRLVLGDGQELAVGRYAVGHASGTENDLPDGACRACPRGCEVGVRSKQGRRSRWSGGSGWSGRTGGAGGSGRTGRADGSGGTGRAGGTRGAGDSGRTGGAGGSGRAGRTAGAGGSGRAGRTAGAGGSGRAGGAGGSGRAGGAGGSGRAGGAGGSGRAGRTRGADRTGGSESTEKTGSPPFPGACVINSLPEIPVCPLAD